MKIRHFTYTRNHTINARYYQLNVVFICDPRYPEHGSLNTHGENCTVVDLLPSILYPFGIPLAADGRCIIACLNILVKIAGFAMSHYEIYAPGR